MSQHAGHPILNQLAELSNNVLSDWLYWYQVAISFFHEIVHCEESISASKHAFDDPSAATMDNVVDAAEKLESSRYDVP